MHLWRGVHSANAKGKHWAQRGHASGSVQTDLYGAANGLNEETDGL